MTRPLVIDTHQHVWDLDYTEYPWLTPDFGPIYRTFTQEDIESELDAAGITHTVLVQAMDSYADTDFMLETADKFPRVAGVVGWVPLDNADEAARALDRYQQDARFVGIRHLIHEDPDPDWLRRDAVQEGLALLSKRGLTFDVVAVLPRHLEHVPWLAERHPELRLVVDHLAKPPIADGGWQPWANQLARAASHPNVFSKISGLNTAAAWDTWSAADLRPYVEHALECFGPNRLMYGGDWPISLLAGDYQKVWRETLALLDELEPRDRELIRGETAVSVYRLPIDQTGVPTAGQGAPDA